MKMNPNAIIHTHWQIAHSRRAGQNLPKSMAAPTLTEKKMKKHEHTTCGINHWGLSGYSSILPRIKFGIFGQESSPQSPTISYRHPLGASLIHQNKWQTITQQNFTNTETGPMLITKTSC